MARVPEGVVWVLIVLAGSSLAACSSDSGQTVNVTAGDFSLKAAVPSVSAGTISFEVHNTGGFTHEMVVVEAADAKGLPTKPDGEVNEDAIPKAAQVGEVTNVFPGQTKTLKVKLAPGTYVLFCNLVDGAATVHFKRGMHAVIVAGAAL